jgi:hypothetical protein
MGAGNFPEPYPPWLRRIHRLHGIASGNFETAILENIRARAHFLVLLTPTALDRSGDPEDWMRREIEAAIDNKPNIVPLMLEGFNFSAPAIADRLTGKLTALKQYNGIPIPQGFFHEAMERLREKFLNVRVDAVLHSASASAQRAATEQKDKATRALPENLEDTLPDKIAQAEEHRREREAEAKPQALEEVRQREAERQPEEERRREAQSKKLRAEEQRRKEIEAEARRQAEEDQRRQCEAEAEAKRQRRREAQAEKLRVEEQRRNEAEAEAKQAEEERRKSLADTRARAIATGIVDPSGLPQLENIVVFVDVDEALGTKLGAKLKAIGIEPEIARRTTRHDKSLYVGIGKNIRIDIAQYIIYVCSEYDKKLVIWRDLENETMVTIATSDIESTSQEIYLLLDKNTTEEELNNIIVQGPSWREAYKTGTIATFKSFIKKWPMSGLTEAAKAIISDRKRDVLLPVWLMMFPFIGLVAGIMVTDRLILVPWPIGTGRYILNGWIYWGITAITITATITWLERFRIRLVSVGL